ncbi:MATE family efflux transporter [Butyrivibrio sp. AC2005]|uniref:MATE family efflux transporter n=1 Tax=Butyrivibrio sp. AC2005 TaxID=1280672 RepID=UPI00047A980F|nr:MATE family efflux transporter [Butyrivibrio sp. AC2005]
MEKHLRVFINRVIQIVLISLLALLLDYLIVISCHDDSIWLGESIVVTASVICGPVVGFFTSMLSCVFTDFLVYGSFEFGFVGLFEGLSIALIGVIYRNLVQDEDKFGFREIIIFNFIQILVNTAVTYLATPPAAVLFFGFIVEDWPRSQLLEEMTALKNNAFSACISIALIGTVLLALCIAIRRKLKETGKLSDAIHSLLKQNFINKEYRSRAFEYSIGFLFAVALTMVDGVVSGHTLGTDALAATSLVFPLVSLSTFLSNFLTSGCSNMCARAKGDHNYERARQLFTLGLLATLLIGVLQTVVFHFSQDLYFGYYKATEEIGAYARDYYKYYVLVPPFMALATFFDEIVSSEGDDMLSYAGYLTSFGVNVGASIILSKTMGMGGLALATALSYIFYLLVVSIHFLKKSNTYKLRFWFSFKDLFRFAEHSLKTNTSGLCMSIVSAAFTKAILLFWGSGYLIANTVLCAMLEIYQMIKGPSEAAEYLIATYAGEKNSEGIKILFKEAMTVCLIIGTAMALLLLLMPGLVLTLYDIEDTPLRNELIKCIRYCAVGVIAASVGGFLGDYYGDTGKPFWSCMMVIFRTALFPILFCVTLSLEGGIVAMGVGMLLAQISAVSIFFGFVFIIKGGENVPFILDDPDYEKVKMNSFEYSPEEYERINNWISDNLAGQGIEENKIEKVKNLALCLFEKTEEKKGKHKVLGECVLRFMGEPEIIIKDNGELFKPDIEDDSYSYDVLLSCNSSTIRLRK